MNTDNRKGSGLAIPASIVIAGFAIAGALAYNGGGFELPFATRPGVTARQAAVTRNEAVTPSEGVLLPVTLGDIGAKLMSVGAIDAAKLEAAYSGQEEAKKINTELLSGGEGRLRMTPENAQVVLNILWAAGLANKSPVLDDAERVLSFRGGIGNLASVGGWTVSKGDPAGHYGKHMLFPMTAEQHDLVGRVAKNIYRPCCDNPVSMPDCNHGMAMLALLELMASQGATEDEMYKAALVANSYWFPAAYDMIQGHLESQGVKWADADPKLVLGPKYSSATGYQAILTSGKGGSGGSGTDCSLSGGASNGAGGGQPAPSCGL